VNDDEEIHSLILDIIKGQIAVIRKYVEVMVARTKQIIESLNSKLNPSQVLNNSKRIL
jgi:hypothetical protein